MDVRVTTSPIRGLEIADRQELDLIITDQRMPEMDGLAFLGRVRERRPRAHRILLTAYPEMEIALRAINDGLVYRFVLKPWDLDDMRVSVRRAVEAKRLADAHASMAAQLSAQFDELERDLTAIPAVLCRGPEIAQVLLNLLVNAADAVESSTLRTVRVRTWERGGKVHLEVSDSGPGIDPAVRNRLFEAFVTTKQNGRGTGLGLSICKNIVESHGGSISVDSESGNGARFTVTLPACA